MVTLIIGKESVGKMTYVTQTIKELHSSSKIYILDKIGELTDKVYEMGLHVTSNINEAEIVVSDGIKSEINDESHYFLITTCEDIDKELVSKAANIVLFPIENYQKVSDLLDIPVEYLYTLKPFEPITVI